MRKRRSGPSRIVAAASGGFLAGAIAMAVVVRGFPNVMRSPNPSGQHPAPVAKPPIPSSTTTPIIEADPLPELRDRQLELPVRGAVTRELRDSFYDTRGATHNHEAIDIMAPRNTPVLAVEDGTIARLFESKAGGTTVYQFDPTTRYVYYYAHLERYADGLREGNHVQRGQALGYVGTSGNAPKDTPHLHFAIFRLTEKKQWWQGSPIDPYEVLNRHTRSKPMRQRLRLRFVEAAILAVSVLVLAACASTTINQVLADPSRYRDRQVQLSGSVVDSYSLANRGAYRIDDDSGQLWVVSDRGTPRKGARVTVKGTIREGFNLGSLGDQIKLPGVGVGLVLVESSHKAKQ